MILLGYQNCGGGGDDGPAGDSGTFSTDSQLQSLSLSIGTLTPDFDPAVTTYNLSIGFLSNAGQFTVNAAANDNSATLSLDGGSSVIGTAAGDITLNPGSSFSVVVTADDGSITTYTINVSKDTADDFAQKAYVKASDPDFNDFFGWSVAISEDTMVVGSYNKDGGSGSVFVFIRNNGKWQQQAVLKASNLGANDYFGWSVAISDDTMVVGAYQEDSSGVNADGSPDESSSISDSGAAYVFVRDSSNEWQQQAFLKASNVGANDEFGRSVAISGDTIVVGSYQEDSRGVNGDGTADDSSSIADSGAAYVFVRDSSNEWEQQAFLKASNVGANDEFGRSVAISGDTIVVGAYQEDSSGVNADGTPDDSSTIAESGGAYVFARNNSNEWQQQFFLKASNPGISDLFGWSVAISGDTVVVSAFGEDSRGVNADGTPDDSSTIADSGGAYVFVRNNSDEWEQQAFLKASNPGVGDQFGLDVAISGDNVVVGASLEDSRGVNDDGTPDDSSSVSNSGAAYVFVRDSSNEWEQQLFLKASNPGTNDQFGWNVAVSGESVVVCAPGQDGSGVNDDGTPDDSSSITDSGAAYVFQ